ncbi:hypothetical protein [Bifidobacterium bifidum]|uniref:hypothetical protein n=1 Tax=Bifidobacterium bifidum TaxID=1681 RepID=UPI000AFD44E6|nr:hypothetical protein [Bifidobacterium bifidum]
MATMMLTSTLRGAAGMIPHALPGLHGGRLAYITTAAAVEPWGFAHTMLTRRQLRQLGFRVTELDVSTAAAPDVWSTLSDATAYMSAAAIRSFCCRNCGGAARMRCSPNG